MSRALKWIMIRPCTFPTRFTYPTWGLVGLYLWTGWSLRFTILVITIQTAASHALVGLTVVLS